MWIATFIEFGYRYEAFTLSTMKVGDVRLLMETIIPRKLVLLGKNDADDAIEELVSFWTFLTQEYQLKNANGIIKYLKTLDKKFPKLMNDPKTGGFMKGILLEGIKEGFDITTEEGLEALQASHNAKIEGASTASIHPKMQPKEKSDKVPDKMKQKYASIIKLTDQFAAKHLNEEYAEMIHLATAALCRKRPSPLEKGQAKSWACGITHAIGMVNFLYDSSQTPHVKASELYKEFGVSPSTGQAKSKTVRDALKMSQLDPNWILPSRLESHPLNEIYNMMEGLGRMGF